MTDQTIPFEHNEQSIVDLVARNQTSFCTSYDLVVPNCFTSFDNEADLFAIRKSGLCDEFEIKVSRSDFLNDFKKVVNYRNVESWNDENPEHGDRKWLFDNQVDFHNRRLIAPWQKKKHEALTDGDMPCNYFWYILKDGIASIDEVPEFAGVFFVKDDGTLMRGRSAKKLHGKKLDFEFRFKIARKLGYRFWDYRFGKRTNEVTANAVY